LVGGGLIRSLGGWSEVRKMGRKEDLRLKGDERILGDSDFVNTILSEAGERYTCQYELKTLGYDLPRIASKVGKLYQLDPSYIVSKGRQASRVEARSLLCYWAVRELGMSVTELARRFGMTPSAVTYAVERGERIATENRYQLRG
jgi:chromosomal replication initiation ATPase DnaA